MATVYKEGMRDLDIIKRIQKIVGCYPDGIWGPKTTAAVKAWQRVHSLKDDGIVGPATLAKMGLTSPTPAPSLVRGVDIIDGFINTHITFCVGRALKYIAIHYTAGSTSKAGTALATRNVFLNRLASADFVVDDEQIVQINPDIKNYYCWAVGDAKNSSPGGARLYGKATNKNTISIEICSNLFCGATAAVPNHSGWFFTDAALQNTTRLVRHLMKTYNIPKENVVRHYDISGKLCPGLPGWNDAYLYTSDGKPTKEKNNSKEWEKFWKGI